MIGTRQSEAAGEGVARRPGLLVIQWLRTPDDADRRDLLDTLDAVPEHALMLRNERGMIDFFFDDPACVVELADTIAATTSQNSRRPNPAALALLKKGVLPSRSPESLRVSGRNEALFYIDKHSLELQVATDPVGFSKVFYLDRGDARLFSSRIATLSPLSVGTDASSVVSFILNGAPLADRTIFEGVTTLRRGCVHGFALDKVTRDRFWDYCPEREPVADQGEARLQEILWETIVESIRTQCEGKRVLLPLSGGFDSSFILGVLAKVLQHPDVFCFSYTNGPAAAGSDADVAKRQAEIFGYPHVDLDISKTTLVSILELNREAGQSMRAPCLEISAYARLRQIIGSDKDVIMPFGDEFFGGNWSSYALGNDQDVLGAVYLRSPNAIDWLSDYAIPDHLALLKTELSNDYLDLIRKLHKFKSRDRAREYIYLDYRISMNLLPLRTFSVAHWFDVCAPLLDVTVLDGLALLGNGQRSNKVFFKKMAQRYLPEIFSRVRSTHRQVSPELRSKIVTDREALIHLAERDNWHIPGLIDVGGILDLIRNGAARGASKAPSRSSMEDRARRLLASLGILENAKRLRHRYLSPFDERLDHATVLTRVLSLAQQASSVGRS